MTALQLHNVDTADHLVSPAEFSDVGLRSSALTLFTDFRRHEPLVIDGWMTATAAQQYMRQSNAKLRLVVDHGGEFIGTITLAELSEERLLKRVAAGERRNEIQVMDLMTHRHELRALDYDDLRRARVGDVIDTLRYHGERHCLVVAFRTHRIRGLIAASDVARRLHTNLDMPAAPTFADVFRVIHG